MMIIQHSSMSTNSEKVNEIITSAMAWMLHDHALAMSRTAQISQPQRWTDWMVEPDSAYRLAHAAGADAGTRSMKAACRTAWNEDDWNAACEVVHSLCPDNMTRRQP